MRKTADLVARGERLLTPNYAPAPVIFDRGEGAYLIDLEGKRYLDFTAGIAVCALGHAHPKLAEAIADQARQMLHISNLYFSAPEIELAERLTALSFADRVFFANSGAEANEAALKIARRYQQVVKGTTRHQFICAERSFHGRTWAAISATGQPKYHEGFGPLVPGFVHVPYNDATAIEAAINEETCAVFLEPLQGEGGLIEPEPGYLKAVRDLCDAHGLLLIFDEIQTGLGRTGPLFAYEHEGVTPDIMTLAKGLGGGVPIGAMLCTDAVAEGFKPGVHASTFGGNPLACRAGVEVLKVLEAEAILDNVQRVGAYLKAALLKGVGQVPGVIGARGRGLLQGWVVEAGIDRAAVRREALSRGLLLTQAGADTLRLSPPLNIGVSHVDEALEILSAAITAVYEEANHVQA